MKLCRSACSCGTSPGPSVLVLGHRFRGLGPNCPVPVLDPGSCTMNPVPLGLGSGTFWQLRGLKANGFLESPEAWTNSHFMKRRPLSPFSKGRASSELQGTAPGGLSLSFFSPWGPPGTPGPHRCSLMTALNTSATSRDSGSPGLTWTNIAELIVKENSWSFFP